MKNKPLLAVAAVLALALAGTAHAQGLAAVKVPFPFVVNGTELPAGTYEAIPETQSTTLIRLVDPEGRAAAVTLTENGGPTTTKDAAFEFAKYGNVYFLSKIDVPGDDAREVMLKPATVEQVLAKLADRSQHVEVGGSSQQ
jgi:hypothetical protein